MRAARFRWSIALLATASLALCGTAVAGGLAQLQAFLGGAKAGQASFRQVVAGRDGRKPQESAGTFAFARPGRFRWAYEKPFEQLIVGDGEKVWVYDRDLNQVIVRKLDRALGSSPAALLAGDNALERNFDLKAAADRDGLEWVEAIPKAADSGFERVRIGFRDNLPAAMELWDTFGNATRLTFSGFTRAATVDPALFRFVVPKGADVVGEPN